MQRETNDAKRKALLHLTPLFFDTYIIYIGHSLERRVNPLLRLDLPAKAEFPEIGCSVKKLRKERKRNRALYNITQKPENESKKAKKKITHCLSICYRCQIQTDIFKKPIRRFLEQAAREEFFLYFIVGCCGFRRTGKREFAASLHS